MQCDFVFSLHEMSGTLGREAAYRHMNERELLTEGWAIMLTFAANITDGGGSAAHDMAWHRLEI